MTNSQPPPKANPSTAATVGTIEYLRRWVVTWKCSTSVSTLASSPAMTCSDTFNAYAAFNTADCAARLNCLKNRPAADGLSAWPPPAGVCLRLAPTENGGLVCHHTRTGGMLLA